MFSMKILEIIVFETFETKKAFLGTLAACEERGNCSILKQSAAILSNFGTKFLLEILYERGSDVYAQKQ